MLKNYLKVAFKVLLRRKFFTFISLFGVGFTLVVLMVFTAFLDHTFRPGGVERKASRSLWVNYVSMQSPDRTSSWDGSPGYGFLDRYVRSLKTPEKVALYTEPALGISYHRGQKITSRLRSTDGVYWEILEFDFITGRPISHEDENNAEMVAVINRATAEKFFGTIDALGQPLTVDGQRFSVIGVVENVPALQDSAYADIWVPISTSKTTAYREGMMGNFAAMVLADSPADFVKIKEEYQSVFPNIEFPDPKEYNYMIGGVDTKFESFARNFFHEYYQVEASSGKLLVIVLGLMLLFMLLPTLNLVNINLSRILERSSEIGVRKAFGASSKELVVQFVTENVLLTLLGGIIGFIGAFFVLKAIASSGLIPYAQFHMNHRLFLQGLALILFFGILSGVLPAWRMSRMHPVEALRGRTQ